MKSGDPAQKARESMRALHAQFSKKVQYHKQKAYIEIKDIRWLVHEFFSAFLNKEVHFTEEELIEELKVFKHDIIKINATLFNRWEQFFKRLSSWQYSGVQPEQTHLHALIDEFSSLVDTTLGMQSAPPDEFTETVNATLELIRMGDIPGAENAYRQLSQIYDGLSAEKRREHYEQLLALFQAIASSRSDTPTLHQ